MSRMPFLLKNIYRAKWCAAHGLRPLARMFELVNAVTCGCDISWRTPLPRSTGFSHRGTGVVISPHAVFGEHVIIGHGVTIGNRMPADGRAPIIGNHVYIGSGAYVGGGYV